MFEAMTATHHEQDIAKANQVRIRTWAAPLDVLLDDDGKVRGMRFEETRMDGSKLIGTGAFIEIAGAVEAEADLVAHVGRAVPIVVVAGGLEDKRVCNRSKQLSVVDYSRGHEAMTSDPRRHVVGNSPSAQHAAVELHASRDVIVPGVRHMQRAVSVERADGAHVGDGAIDRERAVVGQ